MPESLLIRQAQILQYGYRPQICDLIVRGGFIEALGPHLEVNDGQVIDASGHCLLPGLNDHHVHLASMAATLYSVRCGPPEVTDESSLIEVLRKSADDSMLRGYGYHESVAGDLDRSWLDRYGPTCPVRIQHRSGQLWILNSLAMDLLGETPGINLPVDGRIFGHGLMRGGIDRLAPPPVHLVSQQLAGYGVTGVNDMTVTNDRESWRWIDTLQHAGDLKQSVRLSGSDELSGLQGNDFLHVGERKLYLHDHDLPSPDTLTLEIEASHQAGRNVAFHCVTEAELVVALSALRQASAQTGDRVEHGSVIPEALLEQLVELGVTVVTQPNFVAERGDNYLVDVPDEQQPWLYRCASLMDAGLDVAFGTDMPFGLPNPWLAMDAAVNRQTVGGAVLGAAERITPEQAIGGFLGTLEDPGSVRWLAPGQPADLCLMKTCWEELLPSLRDADVALTLKGGEVLYRR